MDRVAYSYLHHQVDKGLVLELLRSEEHTSELQSRLHFVCRLLLEKKNQLDTGASWLVTTADKWMMDGTIQYAEAASSSGTASRTVRTLRRAACLPSTQATTKGVTAIAPSSIPTSGGFKST